MLRSLVIALCCSLLATACGGPEAADETDVLGSTEQDVTSHCKYSCAAKYGSTAGTAVRLDVGKGETVMTATAGSNFANVADTYVYNPAYAPTTAAHQDKAQYRREVGYRMVLLVDKTMRTGGVILPDGRRGGTAILSGPYIPRSIETFTCHRL